MNNSRESYFQRWVSCGSFQPIAPLFSKYLADLVNKLPDNTRVLDFGGGDPTGTHPPNPKGGVTITSSYLINQLLKQTGKSYELVVADAKGCQCNDKNIKFVQGDIQNIECMISGTFDLITSINVLQEPSVEHNVISKLLHHLEDDGKIFVTLPGRICCNKDLAHGIESLFIKGYEARRYTKESITKLFKIYNADCSIDELEMSINFSREQIGYLLNGKEKDALAYLESEIGKAKGKSEEFGENMIKLLIGESESLILPSVFYAATAKKKQTLLSPN